jgi:uncharacterized membrane protein YuzA (DUF378 family)
MIVLRILQLLSQFLVFLGALSVGIFGYFKIDIFQNLLPKGPLRYLQISIGLAAIFLIAMRFL